MKKTLLPPLCSGLVIPGFGQILNHHLKKGLLLLLVTLVLFISLIVHLYGFVKFIVEDPQAYSLDPDGIMRAFKVHQPWFLYIIVALFSITWIYSVVDALVYGIKLDRQKKKSSNESLSN